MFSHGGTFFCDIPLFRFHDKSSAEFPWKPGGITSAGIPYPLEKTGGNVLPLREIGFFRGFRR